MDDTVNQEVKKNDITDKNTTSAVGTMPIKPSVPSIKVQTEIKHSIDDLIKNSKALTGYSKEIAVGALFSSEKQEITKEEFKEKIENFLGRKVK